MMDTLMMENWRVDVCEGGAQALAKIESFEAYDLLLLDSNLPGMSGIELTRRARELAHRQQTPIIVFSARNVEVAARRAGANAFLRKPDDVGSVVKTITRLIAARSKE
jgi:DNA-binding response OmpR family regulator